MLKQVVTLELKKNDKVFSLNLPENVNLGELHDVLFEMKAYIVQLIQENLKKEQPQPEEIPPVPPSEGQCQ